MTLLWSFDLDGVLAEPPFSWNPAINRDVDLAPVPQPRLPAVDPSPVLDTVLSHSWYRFRYLLRPPRPGALDAVRTAAEHGTVAVLTGRHERGRAQTVRWLERHGFAPYVERLVMNATPLSSARYKEAYLHDRPAALHIDDDAATCALLARCGLAVALVDWPRNRGLDYPDGVNRCTDLVDVQQLIERIASNANC